MNIYTIPWLPKIIFNACSFIIRNHHAARRLPKFRQVCLCEKYEVLPCAQELVPNVVHLSTVLLYSAKINIVNKILLKIAGTKLCFVLQDRTTGQSIGYSLYYFNKKDIDENTIHEAYVGMIPEYRGNGTGTIFRKAILEHFAQRTDLYGTSSRVSLSNKASLMSNLKNGYTIKERYFDKYMNEERVYMVCDLHQYRGKEKEDNK